MLKLFERNFVARDNSLIILLFLTFISFASLELFFTKILDFDFLRSDVLWYYNDSINWEIPFNKYHAPLYPLLISFFAFITFGIISHLQIMIAINYCALLLSVYFTYSIFKLTTKQDRLPIIGTLFFTFWPVTGLTYSVYPLSDSLAVMLYIIGLYLLINKQLLHAFIFWGLCLVTHKVFWIFVFCGVLLYLVAIKTKLDKNTIVALFFLVLPLLVLWFGGYFYHNRIDWLLSSSVEIEADRTFFIFDGILDSLFSGGFVDLIKSSLSILFLFASILLFFWSLSVDKELKNRTLSIIISTIVLLSLLNSLELISAVRFSRFIVFPLIWYLNEKYTIDLKSISMRLSILFIIILLVASQFAFSWYMAKVYFAN